MRLSTKGRFAISAMIDVALREKSGPVSLADIASRQQVSLSYLEQMFSRLRHDGLVQSVRGPGGGYTLGHRADAITVADIIGAVDASLHPVKVKTAGKSRTQPADDGQDLTQELWDALNTKMADYMDTITLRSLVLGQLAKGVQVTAKPQTNRGVFKKPVNQPVRTNAPNSVFALGQSLLARG